jgi:hypothetical protein
MKAARIVTLLAGLLAAGGCATAVNTPSQRIVIKSRPPGARVTILPEGRTLTTPIAVELARDQVHTLRFELDGHCRETAYLDRVTSGWRLLNAEAGRLVDDATGSGFRLIPEVVDVWLWPVDSPERACGSAGAVPRPAQAPTPAAP